MRFKLNNVLTNSCIVKHGRQDEQDVVGPVLPVLGHLELLDHQNVQMSGPLHGMENVEQAMLLASCSRREDRAL